MSDLLIARRFQSTVDALRQNLPQSVLLHGEVGVGVTTIARLIAGPDYELIEPVASKTSSVPSIGVDSIRQLYELTRSKRERQVYIIDNAEAMTQSAQHAFLKLLEEPGRGVHFIVVTHLPDRLLPTVRSRLQPYFVPRLDAATYNEYIAKLSTSATTRQQLRFVSLGRPALARRLVDDSERLTKLASLMRDAQVFVGADRYQACQVALQYGKTIPAAIALVDASIAVMQFNVTRRADSTLLGQLADLLTIHERLGDNAQPRLQLLSYVVQ